MNGRDAGFLLLTNFLGDPNRKPLTVARLRELTKKVRRMERPAQQRELTEEDLQAIGCSEDESEHILRLLSQTELLNRYVSRAEAAKCYPITRADPQYPLRLRNCLGLEAPGALWYKGDIGLFGKPKIALVGSRELLTDNRRFAEAVGIQCAKQGYVLVSGHARGADSVAETACLECGGQVISVVSDQLENHRTRNNVLYLAEDGFDIPFTSFRALSRNRIIHALAEKTFVAQCSDGIGGTWSGTCKNLRFAWSPVYCFRDGSSASVKLEGRGAVLVEEKDLQDFSSLQDENLSFL